jgi:hypothetical protein
MTTQHTPGPWQVKTYAYRSHIVADVREEGGIENWEGVASIDESDGQGTANASLIAAAPELLAALNAMLTHMGMDEDSWNRPTFEQARAAVAKAKGTK